MAIRKGNCIPAGAAMRKIAAVTVKSINGVSSNVYTVVRQINVYSENIEIVSPYEVVDINPNEVDSIVIEFRKEK
jgi:hypothetical protein